ncbi:MAG TPA: GEVED domain-containing protein [Chitinophagaceae bacterium]|nr:GEVED domain-containing protein [Chitinophagaceae bacterium]
MKIFLPALSLSFLLLTSATQMKSIAQCGAGYTQAQTNWDNLDFYWNSGGNGPYESYISNAWQQSQKFAIGSNYLTIATSSSAMVSPGSGNSAENATHTGDLAGYTGEDVQFNPTSNGQTITITFNNEVANARFSLYDIDGNGAITVSAVNALSVAQTVTTSNVGSQITITGATSKTATSTTGSNLGNSSNNGSVTFTVAGPVKTITITVTTVGSDAVFWLSDINACVTGSFPTNYNQTSSNQPMTGPTMNQPDYFIVTPDNQSTYMVDPATGEARWLFTDATQPYVNSFGYDPNNHVLYYVSDATATPANNKALKKYDFNTGTISTVIADIGTTLGISTFDQGIESAAASYYDGALYLGIEGGRYNPSGSSNDRTRETIVWRINFDASQNPTVAYQVFATDAYNATATTSTHDYGDLIVKNGILYDFNTARNGSNYSQSKMHHYNLMTGNLDALYSNPGTTAWNGQAAMGWSGQLYYFRATTSGNSGIGTYDGAGNCGSPTNITLVGGGPAWPGGAGDASENFRPKSDFGDAPASYDPNPVSPAVHERSDNIRLGATWDDEWVKRGITANNDVDDALAYAPIMAPGGGGYVAQASVYNNSGANATLIAWLDYNGNGIFDAGEANNAPITVPSSASMQNFWLLWSSTPNSFTNGQYTYLRIRITAASSGMTTAHATGYFGSGEVEDYEVLVDNYPLATHLIDFNAILQDSKVKLNWTATEETGSYAYEVERSADNTNWTKIALVEANNSTGTYQYHAEDINPLKGTSYYRIRILETAGTNRYSNIKKIVNNNLGSDLTIMPNPATTFTHLKFESRWSGMAQISLLDIQGKSVLSSNQRINTGLNEINVDIPGSINSGTYFIAITADGETIKEKIIIKK